MRYPDGSRDCPRCLQIDRHPPHRVTGNPLNLCPPCDLATSGELHAGLAQLQPYLRKHLRFTDYLIEHGRPVT